MIFNYNIKGGIPKKCPGFICYHNIKILYIYTSK